MASTGTPLLAERADVHKACKALETVLGVLNDYCEAITVVALLQKKLAKALREMASTKVTTEIPANAINISAGIFETLSDIDTKFGKLADKEYDGVSAEVRKWFKKLSKDEKNHDEKIASANTRIKQAGQAYEKKSKKNSRDASEEHFRYINLISTLGPEITQEKHNHALQVTQRHTATTYGVAACLSRMADAEWLRACDRVRRFAPSVGQLGEWRALCEGGWMGAIPKGLPDSDEEQDNISRNGKTPIATQYLNLASTTKENINRAPEEYDQNDHGGASSSSAGQSPVSERRQEYPPSTVSTSSGQQYGRPRPAQAAPSFMDQTYSSSSSGPPSFRDQQSNNAAYDSERDMAPGPSLASFPAPPTHIPLPPSSLRPPSPAQFQASTRKGKSVSPVSSHSAESFIPDDPRGSRPGPEIHDSPTSLTSSHQPLAELPHSEGETSEKASPQDTSLRPRVSYGAYPQGDSLGTADREFGVMDGGGGRGGGISKSVDSRERLQGVSRTNTAGSSGSLVAAMRNRYSSQPGVVPPLPKDVPRLPLSVTNLASRYQPIDDQSPPRQNTVSPPSNRQLPNLPTPSSSSPSRPSEPTSPMRARSADVVVPGTNWRDELGEAELREKEMMLRRREREIAMRERELERERAYLMGGGQSSQSQVEFPSGGGGGDGSGGGGYLSPPPSLQASHAQGPPSPRQRQTSLSQPTSPSHASHASSCGCSQCSVSKYKEHNASSSSYDLRPPDKPINLRPPPEKPKSWMRRLSMPVGVSMGSLGLGGEGRRKEGAGTGTGVLEDGRMAGAGRSWEANGGNRSVTNLRR